MKVVFLIVMGFSLVFAVDMLEDNATGLVWQDNSDTASREMNYENAKKYCNDLNLSDRANWKLPTIKELESIVDTEKNNPAIKADFKNVVSNSYWSSSTYVEGSANAWTVYFGSGGTHYDNKYNKYYVRCVSGK